MCDLLLVFRVERNGAGAFALFQRFLVFAKYLVSDLSLFVTACLCLFLHFGDPAVDGFEVFDLQLGIDDFLVAHRIDTAVYMDDVVIVEATQYVQDCICLADIGEEFVSQPFPFAGAFYEAGNIYDFDRSRDNTLGMFDFSQLVQTFVRYGDHADIRFDRTEREVSRLCFCIR